MVLEWHGDLKAIQEGLLWATLVLSHSLLSMASNWSAADLPGTGWLKCDHTIGSPAFSCWKHKHDLLSLFFPTSQKYKEPFLPSTPFSFTQRQAGKFDGWWFRIVISERPLTSGKEDSSSAHLTKYKSFETCFSLNKWHVCAYTYAKKFKPQDTHWKPSLPAPLTPASPFEAATVTRLFCPPDQRHLPNPIFFSGVSD